MGLFDTALGSGLWVKLSLDKQGFDKGMAQAKTDLSTWKNETIASKTSTMEWSTALLGATGAIIAVGTAIYMTTEKLGAMADEMRDLSYSTGLSTDKIQALQYAALLSSTSFDKVAFGINNLTLKVAEFNDESSEAHKAFSALGLDPTGKPMDEVFDDVAISLMGIRSETDRNKIANDLFGKSWKELVPYLKDYITNREEIDKYRGFNEEELKDLEDAKVAWDKLGNSVTIYTGKLIAAAQAHLEKFGKIDQATGKIIEKIESEGDALKEIVPDMSAYNTETNKTIKTTKELADAAQNAQRKFEDLSMAISTGLLSQKETEMDQAELLEKQKKLKEEYAKNLLIIAHDPETSQVKGTSDKPGLLEKNKELGKELDRIQLQIDKNNNSLVKGSRDMSRAYEDMSVGIVGDAVAQVEGVAAAYQSQIDDTGLKYAELESLSLLHWATLAEIGRVSLENLMNYMSTVVDYAGANPIRQAYIIETSSGPDWTPPVYKSMTPPKLTQSDFTRVSVGVKEITEKGTGSGTGGGGTTIIINNPTTATPQEHAAAVKRTLRDVA